MLFEINSQERWDLFISPVDSLSKEQIVTDIKTIQKSIITKKKAGLKPRRSRRYYFIHNE